MTGRPAGGSSLDRGQSDGPELGLGPGPLAGQRLRLAGEPARLEAHRPWYRDARESLLESLAVVAASAVVAACAGAAGACRLPLPGATTMNIWRPSMRACDSTMAMSETASATRLKMSCPISG